MKKRSNIRNHHLAVLARQDPTRLHLRVVEHEARKIQHNRARRKAACSKNEADDETS